MQKTANDICDEIEKATKCRESFTATLVIIVMLGFLAWMSLDA
jgi:hypothetical protein